MKTLILSTTLALLISPLLFAEDTKIEGQAVCAKCQLHSAEKCQAALEVTTADGKKEIYLTEANDKAKELHSEICKGGKPATVQGTVAEKDGKKMLTVSSFEIK